MRVVLQSSVGVDGDLLPRIYECELFSSLVWGFGDLLHRIYECELYCSLVWGLMEISYTEYMNASCPAVQFGG